MADRDLLAAQAQGGIQGANAYRAAQQESASRRQQAAQQAALQATQRGAPEAAVDAVRQQVGAPSAIEQGLGASAANYDAQSSARGARMRDYQQQVDMARGMIGTQANAAGALIDKQSAARLALLSAQERAAQRKEDQAAKAAAAKAAAAAAAAPVSKGDLQALMSSGAQERLAALEQQGISDQENARQASSYAGKAAQEWAAKQQLPAVNQANNDLSAARYAGRAAQEYYAKNEPTTKQFQDQFVKTMHGPDRVIRKLMTTAAERQRDAARTALAEDLAAKLRPGVAAADASAAKVRDMATMMAQNRQRGSAGIASAMDRLNKIRTDPQVFRDAAQVTGESILASGQHPKMTPADILEALGTGSKWDPAMSLADFRANQNGEPWKQSELKSIARQEATDAKQGAKDEKAALVDEADNRWATQNDETTLAGTDLKAISQAANLTTSATFDLLLNNTDFRTAFDKLVSDYLASGLSFAEWSKDQDFAGDSRLRALVKAVAA